MKAETADTVYRELLRRSSADGLAYLREQLAAHEAKGCGLGAAGGALTVEWVERNGGSAVLEADFGDGLNVAINEWADGDGGSDYDAFISLPHNGGRTLASGLTPEAARDAAEKALPAALAELVVIGRAAARALRGETGER